MPGRAEALAGDSIRRHLCRYQGEEACGRVGAPLHGKFFVRTE